MSFKQFDNCNFCRINHNKGSKHKFSTAHQKAVMSSLDKLKIKLQKVSKELEEMPKIKAKTLDNFFENSQKTFWCLFCQNEFKVNDSEQIFFILNFKFFSHLKCVLHKENVLNFFKNNSYIRKKFEISNFLVLDDFFDKVKNDLSIKLDALKRQNEIAFAKNEMAIKQKEDSSGSVVGTMSLPSVGPSKLLSNAHSKPTNEDLRINDFDVVDHCAPIGPTISDLLQHRLKKKMLEEAQKKIPIKTNKSSTQSTTYQTKLFLPYKIRRALDKNKNQKHLSEELKNKYIHQKQPLSRFTTNKLSSLNKLVSASEGGDISIHWIDTMGNIEFCGNVSYKKNHSEFCGVGSNSNKHHGCNLKPYVSRRNSRNL